MQTTTTIDLWPLEDRVFLLQDPPETISSGGILIPEEAQRQETIGTVVAVGPGKFYDFYDFAGTHETWITRYKPMRVKVGDRVIYPKFAGSDITVSGVLYKLCTDEQVVAILSRVQEAEVIDADFRADGDNVLAAAP